MVKGVRDQIALEQNHEKLMILYIRIREARLGSKQYWVQNTKRINVGEHDL